MAKSDKKDGKSEKTKEGKNGYGRRSFSDASSVVIKERKKEDEKEDVGNNEAEDAKKKDRSPTQSALSSFILPPISPLMLNGKNKTKKERRKNNF